MASNLVFHSASDRVTALIECFAQDRRLAADETGMSTRTGEPSRWMGVGYSTSDDAATAGKAGTAQAVDGRSPSLLIVYSSTGYDLEHMLDGVRGQADADSVIIGCTTTGGVVPGRTLPWTAWSWWPWAATVWRCAPRWGGTSRPGAMMRAPTPRPAWPV